MLLNFEKGINNHSFISRFTEIKDNFTVGKDTDYLLILKL